MKIAIIADTHFGIRSDSLTVLQYQKRFLDTVFFPYLKKHKIRHCIHLGDLVDRRKYINFRTLEFVKSEFVYRLGSMGVDTHIVLGNHDCSYKNTNRVNSPDGVFSTVDGKKEPWIYVEPKDVDFDGFTIGMLPWITSDNHQKSMEYIKNTKASVLAAHLELSGFEMQRGIVQQDGQDRGVFSGFDLVMTGHFHTRSNDGRIFYVGAPYQMTWGDYGDERGFHVFDTETRKLEFIPNTISLFQKVYYDDQDPNVSPKDSIEGMSFKDLFVKVVVVSKTRPFVFDSFVDRIYADDPGDVVIVDEVSMIMPENVDVDELAEDTPTLLKKFVYSSGLNIDKDVLHGILQGLYVDAVHQQDQQSNGKGS